MVQNVGYVIGMMKIVKSAEKNHVLNALMVIMKFYTHGVVSLVEQM